MKIVLDNIIFSLQNAGGISTYWGELTQRFLRDHTDLEFIENSDIHNIVRMKIDVNQALIIGSQKNYNLLVDRFRKIRLKHLKSNFIFHSSYNRYCSNPNALQVCTVHDFVHEKFYSGPRRIIHSWQKSKAINGADKLIAISENTKMDIIRFNKNIKPDEIKVIYNGVSDDFYPLERVSCERPFLLFIGSREKYKNFDFALDVVEGLAEFDLYIVGAELDGHHFKDLNRKVAGRWRLFSAISNEELNILYNKAYALFYPSSYEGFGIPILESMKAGCPFIALKNSSIPEVAGNAGFLMEDLNIADFRLAILDIESNRQRLVQKGIKQAEKFSWEKCYRETKDVYNELI